MVWLSHQFHQFGSAEVGSSNFLEFLIVLVIRGDVFGGGGGGGLYVGSNWLLSKLQLVC